MRYSKSLHILGFINVIVGAGCALVGLLLILAWVFLGVMTSPPSPLFNCLEIPFLALGFLSCFGLVAFSGVGLLRGVSWGFLVAAAACLGALSLGAIMFYLELKPGFPINLRASDIVAVRVGSFYEDALALIPLYWIYGTISALMLTLSCHSRPAPVAESDSQPEGLPL